MRQLTITLPAAVYHRLEIMAARDDDRIAEGVEKLLKYLVTKFEGARDDKS